jgi:hypothetical protein
MDDTGEPNERSGEGYLAEWRPHLPGGHLEAVDPVGDERRRIRYDPDAVAPSVAVVAAVVAETGLAPVEVPPLFSAVDPEALDALFRSGDASLACSISFTYWRFEVSVSGTGEVALRPADAV